MRGLGIGFVPFSPLSKGFLPARSTRQSRSRRATTFAAPFPASPQKLGVLGMLKMCA
jgi:aryl-alcohol dehydrogenase-like predicted oxidoreductase